MNSASEVMTGIINGAIGSITGTEPVVDTAASSGLPAEIVFGIVIAVALWTVVLWIGFKK